MRIASVLLWVALFLGAPTLAHAQETGADATSELASIRDLALRANYRAALPAARAFLDRTDLPAALRNEGLELLATIHLAMRAEPDARAVLAQLYARDPAHRLRDPDASPLVQSAFARARESAAPLAVAIAHEPPLLEQRAAPEVSVRVAENADAVHEIRLAYRASTGRETTLVLPLDAEGAASGRIPLDGSGEAYTIEYWLEASAPSGHALATLGSPDAPLTIEVPAPVVVAAVAPVGPIEEDRGEPASGDVTSEWWFWTLIGVVVVGAGVGVGVGVALGSEGPTDGSLGNVSLPLVAF